MQHSLQPGVEGARARRLLGHMLHRHPGRHLPVREAPRRPAARGGQGEVLSAGGRPANTPGGVRGSVQGPPVDLWTVVSVLC